MVAASIVVILGLVFLICLVASNYYTSGDISEVTIGGLFSTSRCKVSGNTCTDTSGSHTPQCASISYLNKYSCSKSSGTCVGSLSYCQSGCSNGACLSASVCKCITGNECSGGCGALKWHHCSKDSDCTI